MCGRVAIYSPPHRFAMYLNAKRGTSFEDDQSWDVGRPSWNVGPQRRLFAVTEKDGELTLDKYKWGLVPGWAKDTSIGNKLFNARGETVAEKPSFRSAFAKRPAVVTVDGFFEWDHRPATAKQPNFFHRADGDPLLLAGLYEYWRDKETPDAPPLTTCTIITTAPNADMDEIHDRMPVVLNHDDVEVWLNVLDHTPDERQLLLRPAPTGTLGHYVVSSAVGSVKNDGPELIEPEQPGTFF